ncbi:MAG: hypothetical protein AAF682_32780, partial [Planctomycetota bacterium]
EALSAWRGQRALARAREAHAWNGAAARGASVPTARPDRDAELLAAEIELGPGAPALRGLVGELRFLEALNRGVARLRGGDPEGALGPLTTAAELRGERADVHLYLALALQRAEVEAGAKAAFAAALERCPRVLATPAGERALALGFRPERARL